ncbi:protein kinase [Streptomyces roseirectus]|uniref:Protein kinase n=1 Tax=Streptomyces roseirectus TaxID=2768066 RepID=A0A7H0IJG7_9ACTN|nr:serine/threonine-protein kinase [Streptomyces roseirectus]QNP72933.1 protein kinase [Streptomyces roseirectus]
MSGAQAGGVFGALGVEDPGTVGPYRLVAKLGAGGMGAVYLSHTPGGHPVAVKTVRPELAENAEFRRRFRQEVEAARRVQGFYTAPVLDHDVEGTHPWLVTAYVAGPSLAEAVGRHGPLPVPSVLLLLAGVAEALSAIHGADVVHRDLKPSNVLLAADGPRVIDFGIARASDATSLTGTGVAPGTPAFMSPEQAAGRPVTPASDVFSLGQIAVFAATGRGAYGDGSAHALLYRIVHETPDLTGLPAELAFVARCLDKDPANRPTPAEVIALCQQASPTPLRQSGEWLPAAVGADIPTHAPEPAAAPQPTDTARALGTPTSQLPDTPTPFGPAAPQAPTHPAYHPPQLAYTPTHINPPQPPPPVWHPPAPRRTTLARPLGLALAAVLLVPLALWGVNRLTDTTGTTEDSGDDTPVSATPTAPPTARTYKDIDLPLDYFIRFGDTPPKPVNDGGSTRNGEDSDFYFFQGNDDELIGSVGREVVVLGANQQGTLQTCRTETRFTRELPLPQVPVGTRMCVHSAAGHIALVTYRGTSPKTDPSRYITVDVTIWRNAET